MAALYDKRWNCCDNCGCYDCACCAKEHSSELEEGGILVAREETSPASLLLTREAVAAAHAAAVKSGRFESFKQVSERTVPLNIVGASPTSRHDSTPADPWPPRPLQIISQLGVEERNENCWELCGCGACECC